MRKLLLKFENWLLGSESMLLTMGKLLIFVLIITAPIAYALHYVEQKVEATTPYILLQKDRWRCAHSHTVLTPIVTGKTVTVISEQLCDNYVEIMQ
jgi:hypothetical protein